VRCASISIVAVPIRLTWIIVAQRLPAMLMTKVYGMMTGERWPANEPSGHEQRRKSALPLLGIAFMVPCRLVMR
jgi:hypothetical protein